MDCPPPVSVLLPTVEWTVACSEVVEQLRERDELLVIADDETDPVATRAPALPDGVRLIFAGEPEGCSGKANAIAAGMRAAAYDRVVWTDDDFTHPPDWLDRLHADYERHGPVSELPFFTGRDPLAIFLEPLYAVGGTLGAYAGDKAWGGGVLFERSDLDEGALLEDLERSVSDDGLLSEHLDVTPLRRTRRVPIGGSIHETLERHVRFTQIAWRHEPGEIAVMGILASAMAVAALLFPLPSFALLTAFHAGVYAAFGVRRWTFLLGYPTALVQVPLLVFGIARRTFVWGGRRYRWHAKYDVEVVGPARDD